MTIEFSDLTAFDSGVGLTYFMAVDGKEVIVADTPALMSFAIVQRVAQEQLGLQLPHMDDAQWRATLRPLLDTIQVKEAKA